MPNSDGSPQVRPYRAQDLEACLAVFDSNRPKYFSDEERLLFADFLRDLPGPYLVVENDEGQVVACGGWAVDPATAVASFCWGMVEHSRHGQGLGKQLTLARLDGIHRCPDVRCIRLDTSQHTRGFYENLGFRVTEVEKDGYWPGLDRCEMERRVTADAG